MNTSNIPHYRLIKQQITQTQFETPHELVAWMGAMQGQDYSGVKWSIGLRVPGSTDASIEQALIDKCIVRTWAMRGTLHIVAAQDLRWLVKLLGARVIASAASRHRELELDDKTFAHTDDLIAKALRDGQQYSRTALISMLNRNNISTEGQRAAYILQHAALKGLVCQITTSRNTPTYIAVEDAVPLGKNMTHAEAVAELVKRYYSSHGPATLQDFVWWSGLKISDVRAGLAANAAYLIEDRFDGQSFWMSAATHRQSRAASVHLLPGFDEYLLGYQSREIVIPKAHMRMWTAGGGMFTPLVVMHGTLAGNWKRTLTKGKVTLAIQPARPLSEAEVAAIGVAAERYGRFMQLPVSTTVKELSVSVVKNFGF